MKVRIDWWRLIVLSGLAALLLYVLAFKLAQAGEAQLTWVAPTKNCDGTSLTNLTSYNLSYGQATTSLPLSPLSYTVKGLTPGTWWFSLAAVTPTARSEFVTVTKTIAPEQFKTMTSTIYTVVKRRDSLLMLPVGTAPVGTQCVAAQTINGYYVVPRASVTWSGTVRPEVVFAVCG